MWHLLHKTFSISAKKYRLKDRDQENANAARTAMTMHFYRLFFGAKKLLEFLKLLFHVVR